MRKESGFENFNNSSQSEIVKVIKPRILLIAFKPCFNRIY